MIPFHYLYTYSPVRRLDSLSRGSQTPYSDYMITKDELDKHIKATGRANRINENRRYQNKKNEHDLYCFTCCKSGRETSWICEWSHKTYYGNLTVLHNMLRYLLSVNRSRKTLTNKFGRPKNPLPKGFDPDIQDRMIASDVERHHKRTGEGW